MREALEMLAIRLAVPRTTPELLERLQGLVARMQDCAGRDDVDGFFELNAQFHQTFVDASGNGRLTELYRQLVEQLGRYRGSSLALRGSLKRSIAEHRTILRAVASGRRRPGRAPALRAHPGAAAPPRGRRRRAVRPAHDSTEGRGSMRTTKAGR